MSVSSRRRSGPDNTVSLSTRPFVPAAVPTEAAEARRYRTGTSPCSTAGQGHPTHVAFRCPASWPPPSSHPTPPPGRAGPGLAPGTAAAFLPGPCAPDPYRSGAPSSRCAAPTDPRPRRARGARGPSGTRPARPTQYSPQHSSPSPDCPVCLRGGEQDEGGQIHTRGQLMQVPRSVQLRPQYHVDAPRALPADQTVVEDTRRVDDGGQRVLLRNRGE